MTDMKQALDTLVSASTAVLIRLQLERKDKGPDAVFPCAAMIEPLRAALDLARPFLGDAEHLGLCVGCDQDHPTHPYRILRDDGTEHIVRYCTDCAEVVQLGQAPQILLISSAA